METAGCYVHIPFCVRKCAYCDFNSYSGYTDSGVARYVAALEREIRSTSPLHPVDVSRAFAPSRCVDTIFFGGGTPTAIPAVDEARLLKAVMESLPVSPEAEITTEANPGTMDTRHLAVLREAGFNRISFGVQSFDPGLLKTLDRIHSADEGKNAVRAARDAGFENVSIDLMFALPRQAKSQWQATLDQAFALGTDHISLYSLIVEEGTGFYTLYRKGRLPLPDEDTAAEMFQMAIDSAEAAGFVQYEISNFARPGRECRHNVHYWRNEPYYGFGCGAVSYLDGSRCTRVKSPVKYAEMVDAGADLVIDCETSTPVDAMAETMMLGLRLTREGIDCVRFAQRFGVDPRDRYAVDIDRFVERGLLEVEGDNLRLTKCGVFLANEVMMAFV
jgi:oxygen-independent coproporphyrinogen-3 oxidase